jgi:hypothetical protein
MAEDSLLGSRVHTCGAIGLGLGGDVLGAGGYGHGGGMGAALWDARERLFR